MGRLTQLEEYLDREFGELDINVPDAERRADRISASVPQVRANEVLNQEAPEWGGISAPAPDVGNFDRTRLFGAGVMDLAEMGVGAVEYGARSNRFTRGAVPALTEARGAISEVRDDILAGVSPEYLERVGKEVMTLDPSKSIWRSGNPLQIADAIYGKMVRSAPSTLTVMLPAARLFRIGATRGALTYLGASEGGLSVGAIQNNLADEIAGMTHEELLKESPRYADIYQSTGNEDAARQVFTNEAQGLAPLVGGLAVAGISLATGRLLKPVFEAGGDLGILGRGARGFLAEAPQEGSQGASEQLVQNFAAQIYDEQRSLGEGVVEAFGQEGLIGGLTGGTVAAVAGSRPQPPVPPPQEDVGGQLTLPGFGPQQPQAPTEEAPEPPTTFAPNVIYNEQQQEFWPDPGTTEAVPIPRQMEGEPGTQGVLPLGDTRPLRERGPGNRVITDVQEDVPTQLPDEMDQPTAEPIGDIEAQLNDMQTKGGRTAVYLSPDQRNAPRQLPKGARVLPNFDGKGGVLIAKNSSVAKRASNLRREAQEGKRTMQEVIGILTQAGRGKPVDGQYVVQLRDNKDNVARESMVSTRSEAIKLKNKWGKGAVITTPDAALQRRDALMEDTLRTEDPAEVASRMDDLEQVVEDQKVIDDERAAAEDKAQREEIQRQQEYEEAIREPFDPSINDATLDAASGYAVTYIEASEKENENKTLSYTEGEPQTKSFPNRNEAEKFAARQDKKNARLAEEYGTEATKSKINMAGSRDLDIQFERAVRSYADRAATAAPSDDVDLFRQEEAQEDYEPGSATTVEGRVREKNKTPGAKVKFIKRERDAQIRRQREARGVKDTKVTVQKGKKPVDTKALTYEKVVPDETISQRFQRKARVKEANKRLQMARARAKRFQDRFLTSGPYGSYVEEQTNLDGTPTQEAKDFIKAKAQFEQLMQLAKSTLTSGTESSAHITLAKKVAAALERVRMKGMTPAKFAAEFAEVADENLARQLKTAPAKTRETIKSQTTKVKKQASAKKGEARSKAIKQAWSNDPLYNEIFGPVLAKFQRAAEQRAIGVIEPYLRIRPSEREVVYTPTDFEMAQIKFALRNWQFPQRYNQDIFYKPMKAELQRLGFQFDEAGRVSGFETVTQPAEEGKIELPGGVFMSAERIASRDDTKPPKPTQVPKNMQRDLEAERLAEQEARLDRETVRRLQTANALIQKFKDNTSSSKTTINGLKRQEQRFIRGLRKINAWTDTAPGMGVIRIGEKSKTYRLVGPRLDNRSMQKAAAREHVQKIARIPVPRRLLNVQRTVDFSEQVDSFVERNTLELFMASAKPDQYDANYREAANAIGDVLESVGEIDLQTALNEVLNNAPKGSFYYQLAEKLFEFGMGDVTVRYGQPNDFEGGEHALFRPNTNEIVLNREGLNEVMERGDQMFGGRVMHVFTHEGMHAATHNAIRSYPQARAYFERLRTRMREEYQAQQPNATLPYGMRPDLPIDEFVVEVFSNEQFQEFAKRTPAKKTTVMRRIYEFLRELLGLSNETPASIFEAVMATESMLYEGSGLTAERYADTLNIGALDTPLRDVANTVISRVENSSNIVNRVRDRLQGGLRFTNAAMNLMTMEQFRETFDKYFSGTLGKYVEAFNRRNAYASQLMHLPEQLAQRWTKLKESNPEEAVEVSRIMTEARMSRQTADEGSGDLQTRFESLSDEAKAIYRDVRKYYRDSIKLEQKYMLQSALRGIAGIEFSTEQLDSIETRDDLSEMLEPHINETDVQDMVDELWRISRVGQVNEGDYFPLMRYGEEVVFAEKQTEQEFFEDRREAWARRQEIESGDPTLDVDIKKTDGRWEVRVFERDFRMAESKSEIEQERQAMVEMYGEEAVKDVQLKFSGLERDASINSNSQLMAILGTLKDNAAAQAAIKNFYLRSLAESSMRKHEIRSNLRRGVNYDLQHRNLATYAKQSAYYTSQLRHGWQMSEAVKEMQEFTKDRRQQPGEASTRDLSKVVRHLIKRDQMGTNLPEVSKLVRTGVEGTHFFMLTSPSYWAINATQPWMISLPTMAARHGYNETLAALGHIQKLVVRPLAQQVKKSKGGLSALTQRALTEESFSVIDQVKEHIRANAGEKADEYIELLDELRDAHIIDINVFTEMRELAAGKANSRWTNMVDASRIMAHLTEVNNRVLTALSAYELELQKTGDREAATKYAGDMVSQTQFNYSSQNKPPLFQSGGPLGSVAPLMFQFMQWPQHMYAHLIRNFARLASEDVITRKEARRAVTGLLATHAAVGGMVGMMLQPIKWAFGFAMMALGDDDDPNTLARALSGETFDHFVADVTSDLFGTHVSTAITRGLPAAVGVDLSARMSMGTFYFIDLRGDSPQSVLGSLVASFGGATLNQGVKFTRGLGQAMDGDILKGIETASPKMARDLLRAIRYYNEGLVNSAGDTVIDGSEMSPYELLVQSIGFQPTDVSQFYSRQNAIKEAERYTVDRKSELMKDYRNATSPADKRAIRREIREFNRSNPQERITASALLRNQRQQRIRETRFRRYGANIDERKARFYEEYGDPYE